MSILRRVVAHPAERRSISYQDVWGAGLDLLGGQSTHAGTLVNTDRALRYSAVYACVRLLAESVASLPVDTYVRDQRVLTVFRPAPKWIARPNPELTRFEYFERVMASLLLEGNAYSYVVRDARGVAEQLWPLDPRSVEPQRLVPGGPITYQVYDTDRDLHATFAAHDIIHVRAFGPQASGDAALKGISVIRYGSQGIGLGLAAEEFAARFYGQGANPGGVIEVDAPLRDDTVARRMAASWVAAHSGTNKAHLPAVLEGAKWRQLTVNPVDAQALEARQWQVIDIARWFRCPPHKIGEIVNNASQGGGAGLEAQNIMFVTDSVRPWLERIEERYSLVEYTPGEAQIRFDTSEAVRGDTLSQNQAFLAGRNGGWLSVNDIRGRLGLAPVDGGDNYLQPLNMGPLGTDPTAERPSPPPPPAQRRIRLTRDRFGRPDGALVGDDDA